MNPDLDHIDPSTTGPATRPTTRPSTRPSTGPTGRPSRHRAHRWTLATLGIAGVVMVATSCAGSMVHNYRTFQSALDRGASCSELYDQRARFDDEDTLAKIDRDLTEIGCTSRGATRTDD
jgi:hypothetical protein